MKNRWRSIIGGLVVSALGVAVPAHASEQEERCLAVKGWETLPETGRLCAYLADPEAMRACEERGYRLDEGLSVDAVASVQQSLLLCQDEYVIEVRGDSSETGTLSITTALLETSGVFAGDYTRGRVLGLERDGPLWRQTSDERWSNYQDGGP